MVPELLIECAWSASRKKESAFQVRYHRLRPKIGHKRALVAVAHALTKAIYHVLATSQPYREEQPELLNEVQRQRIIRHHTRRLLQLGCWLTTEKLTPLQEWYASRCLPTIETELKKRGRKPKHTDASQVSRQLF